MRGAPVLCVAIAFVLAGPAVCAGSAAADGVSPSIVAVYPNPATPDDRGEFVAVRVPPGTDLGALRLVDGESVARGPDRTAGGTVVLSTAPAVARNLTGRPVYGLRGDLSLSNGGERVTLRRGDEVRDATTYPEAPEAEVWRGSWVPLGATSIRPATVAGVETRAFALPDDAGVPLDVVRSADRRLYLAGYTFESRRVAAALTDAAARGVDVRILLEGDPVGGIDPVQRALLDRLARIGVNVTVMDGARARYRFHHAKYAVVDDRVLVTSENWGPTGTGGGNRGWGVVVHSARLADRLGAVFAGDAGWRDGVTWRANATDSGSSGPPARAAGHGTAGGDAYPRRFPPRQVRADAVRLVVAPDNAGREIRRLLRSANRSLAVQQVSIEPGHPFLNETIAAARRGVRVRVLLSGAWYVREQNRRVIRHLRRVARREDLPLSARLADPRSRYRVVHVKGVVVDGRRVLVGSVNWNAVAVSENREVAVIVDDPAVARYFRRVFVADWRGGAWRVTAGLVALAAACAVATVRLARRRVAFT